MELLDIYYKNWAAQPMCLYPRCPLCGCIGPQMLFFLSKGYRVIATDRADMVARLKPATDTTWTTMPTI
jgi:hypothetical protein